ncbi:MAG: hypothetical protein LBN24_11805 [Mediterranea sp.]|jgi:tetratricopeptide (TPR) repeat protein|nr:hypothetical protein [Mediterranea sp.]
MKRIILILSLLLAVSGLSAQQNDAIAKAMDSYDYETALTLIARQHKSSIPLLYQKSKALRGLSLNAEALATYQEIISADSTQLRAYIEAADCCRSLAKSKQALQYYRQALSLSPGNKYVRIQQIRLLLALQDYREALGESSLLTETDSSLIALHLQAQSFEGMQELLPAMGCYYNIQAKYPSDYLAAAKLGAMNIAAGEYGEAIAATEKYRALDSTNIVVNQQNALAYCMNKEYPKAIQRYKALTNQGDSTFYTCYYLGVSYYATQQFYEAHDILEVALRYDPQKVDLLYYLGRACSKTSWKKQGVEYLQKAIDLSIPTDSTMNRLYNGMADCYKMAQMYKEQIATLRERYEKYDKQNHRLLYSIAFVYYYSLQDKKNTERYLEAFLKTRPKEPAPKSDKGNNEEALGGLVLDESNYYNAAEKWLKDLQNKKKVDEFFQNGTQPSSPPISF